MVVETRKCSKTGTIEQTEHGRCVCVRARVCVCEASTSSCCSVEVRLYLLTYSTEQSPS